MNASVLVEAVPETRELLGDQPPLGEPARRRVRATASPRADSRRCRPSRRPSARSCSSWTICSGPTSPRSRCSRQLVRDPDSHHLLLVGAYRDTEVTASHPLALALERAARDGHPHPASCAWPRWRPRRWRAWCARPPARDTGRALELGHLIHSRTGGNPFSIREFLRFLHDQELLRFDARAQPVGVGSRPDRSPGDPQRRGRADGGRAAAPAPGDGGSAAAGGLPGRGVQLPGSRRWCTAPRPRTPLTTLWSAIEQGFVLPLSKDYLLLDPQGGTPAADGSGGVLPLPA